jgi:hypothetical protein
MLILVTSLLLAASADSTLAARCSPVLPTLSNTAVRDTFVVLEATPDSVAVPFWYRPFGGRETYSRFRESDSVWSRPETVYGQKFRVRQASGQPRGLRRGSTVIVIWWGLGISCQRARPYSATNPRIQNLVILSPARPRADWLEGTPLFDAWVRVFLFSPERAGVTNDIEPPLRPLSLADFLEFLRLLPAPDVLFSRDSTFIAPLVRWADASPERWTLYPAVHTLCDALRTHQRAAPRCPPPYSYVPPGDSSQQMRPPPAAP